MVTSGRHCIAIASRIEHPSLSLSLSLSFRSPFSVFLFSLSLSVSLSLLPSLSIPQNSIGLSHTASVTFLGIIYIIMRGENRSHCLTSLSFFSQRKLFSLELSALKIRREEGEEKGEEKDREDIRFVNHFPITSPVVWRGVPKKFLRRRKRLCPLTRFV